MRTRVLLALACLALWHLGLRIHGLSLPMISDEGEYSYQADLLKEGGLPYRDAYNQKPPAVFFLYRFSRAVFGENARAPRLLAIAFSWAVMALLFALTPAGWSLGARLAAPAAYASLSTLPVGDLGFAANTEVFLAGFTTLAAFLLGVSPLAAGLAAGAAVMTKQTALWAVLGLGLLTGRPRKAAAYAAGCAVFPALFLAYFALRGGAADYLDQAWRRNLDYAAVVFRSGAFSMQLSWLAHRAAPALLLGTWPAAALAAYGLSATRTGDGPEGRIGLLAVVWLGLALAGAAAGLWFFPHYFLPAFPPLSLAAALGVEKVGRSRPRAAGLLAAAMALYPAAVYPRIYFADAPQTVARKLMYPNPLFESAALGEHLRERTGPKDRIYVFGSEPQIYVYARRRAATRHIYVYPLTLFPRGARDVENELAALSAAPPRFIVYVNQPASTLVASKAGNEFRNGILALLERGYRWTGTVEIRPDGSRAAFWSDGEGPASGAAPDWRVHDRIYLFERKI